MIVDVDVPALLATHTKRYTHMYYQYRGSQHWWCRCFTKGTYHECLSQQERAQHTFPGIFHTTRLYQSEPLRQAELFIRGLVAKPFLREIRLHTSDDPCPWSGQWELPPQEATSYWLHWEHLDEATTNTTET